MKDVLFFFVFQSRRELLSNKPFNITMKQKGTMVMKQFFSTTEVAEMLGISRTTLHRWESSGKLRPHRVKKFGLKVYAADDLLQFPQFAYLSEPASPEPAHPLRKYTSIELFAGAGGLAVGLERAGFEHLFLNEIDKDAAATLRQNRPKWNVIEGDVSQVVTDEKLSQYRGKVDLVTGGFPCQAFSFAGLKKGMEDARGTLFYEFARVVRATQPAIAIGENVRGLLSHNDGETLKIMINVLESIGYWVITPRVLNAIFYQTPQLRERLFIVAIRKDLDPKNFSFPRPVDDEKPYVLADALRKGRLYKTDVPPSQGQDYSEAKKYFLDKVPPGGYWKDLPLADQKEFMGKSFFLGGGKTGMARRMAWSEPCLTLTCSPAQKQTERCHPDETRPFTVREYARIQTFPDDWKFYGSLSSQYKQIGNAVPVNLGFHIGKAALAFLHRTDSCLNEIKENMLSSTPKQLALLE